jgi:hypothetical protein
MGVYLDPPDTTVAGDDALETIDGGLTMAAVNVAARRSVPGTWFFLLLTIYAG